MTHRSTLTACALLLGSVALGGAACSNSPPVEPRRVAEAERPVLLDRTREIVRPHCGECHTSSLPTAKPEAVAVFDFEREDWGAAMDADQLARFRRSIARQLEPAGADLAEVDAYVADLLARAAP